MERCNRRRSQPIPDPAEASEEECCRQIQELVEKGKAYLKLYQGGLCNGKEKGRNPDAGVDPKTVQYLAGHENSKVTMDIYAKVKYNKPEQLCSVVNQALKPPSSDWKEGQDES
jgi:hypothetical protein